MSETKKLTNKKEPTQNIGKISFYNGNSNNFIPLAEDSKLKDIKENYHVNNKNVNNNKEKSIRASSQKPYSTEEIKDNQEPNSFNQAKQESRDSTNRNNNIEIKSKEIMNNYAVDNNYHNEDYGMLEEMENNSKNNNKSLENENIKIKQKNNSFTNASNINFNTNNRFDNVSNNESAIRNMPNNFNNISNVNNVNCNTNSTFNVNYYNNKFENLAQKHISQQNNYSLNFQKKKEFNLSFGEVVRIFKIFKIIAEGEKQVEIVRQVLSEVSQFDPFATFKFFDSDGKNFLTKNDFQNYLK